MALDLRILGPLEVRKDGDLVTVPGHKARVLLACLIAHRGNTVSRDRLIDAIWGDTPPKSAVNTLHTYITHLRSALQDGSGSGPVKTHATGYQLELPSSGVDAWRLETAVADARRHLDRLEHVEAGPLLDRALLEWRGPPFEEFLDANFAMQEAHRLADLRLAAEQLRVEALLEVGDHTRATELLRSLVTEFQYQEDLWEKLMLAMYRSGRQTEALAAFRELAETLVEIGLEPSESSLELETRILERDPSLLRASHTQAGPRIAPNPVPRPADYLVGRVLDLEALDKLAQENRLITLTGIGGVGKSRLAMAAVPSWETEGRYVDLAAVSDVETALTRMSESLGVGGPTLARLAIWISTELSVGEMVTLMVDNVEHLADEIGPVLADLVTRGDRLQIVVTSREPLGVPGEVTYAVRPLAVDSVEFPSEAELLFLKRSHIDPVGELEHAAIRSICRAVNGIPAAVEIAAGGSRVLSLPELAENLDALVVDEGGRHSLSNVVEWSFRAMSDRQRILFMAASLFVDGFTFDALLEVTGRGEERVAVLDDLRALIDRSLVTVERGPGTRYRILDVFRDFGLARLDATEDLVVMRGRFVEYFANLAERLEDSFGTERWQSSLERVDADDANVTDALKKAVAVGDVRSAFRIAGPMGRYWRWRGRSAEGVQRLTEVSALKGADLGLRAKVQRELAGIHRITGDFMRSMDHARTALDLYSDLGDEAGKADALYDQGLAEIFAGRFHEARPLLEESAAIWKELGERSLSAFPMIPLAWLEMIHGQYERAETMWTSILTNVDTALFPEQSGITFRVAELALYQGQYERASEVAAGALEAARRARYPYHEAGARSVLARIGQATGDLERAGNEAEMALKAARESGNVEGMAQASMVKGQLDLLHGDVPGALKVLRTWTQYAGHIGGSLSIAALASYGARIQMKRGEWSDAARLFAAEEAIRTSNGLPAGAPDRASNELCLEEIRRELGDPEFEHAFDEGSRLSGDAVISTLSSWLA
jgi:DNA-binding SARP family transcriptional activator/predicted ATPase